PRGTTGTCRYARRTIGGAPETPSAARIRRCRNNNPIDENVHYVILEGRFPGHVVLPRGFAGVLLLAGRADHVPLPTPGIFDRALLSLVVDIDDAKAYDVAVGPFKVVEERPQEVSPHVGTLGTCIL